MMSEFPSYDNILNSKFLSFYLNKIYMPLNKLKRIEIDRFDYRRDFEQVLEVIDYDDGEMKELVYLAADENLRKCQ